jgi:phosphoglycerate kinase
MATSPLQQRLAASGPTYKTFERDIQDIIREDTRLDDISLEQILEVIPSIEALPDLPPGTPALIRVDLDMPLKDGKVADLSRVEANSPTIRWCLERGWIAIIWGHLGRNPKVSVAPVCDAYSRELNKQIELVEDWMDGANCRLVDQFVDRVRLAQPGAAFMLQNTRKYDIETMLWRGGTLNNYKNQFDLAQDIRQRLTCIEINEAIAASNNDFSSTVTPLFMEHTALGNYIGTEFKKHVVDARRATTVVVSGLKLDKLDDLEGIVRRGVVRRIISAGALAMALRLAQAKLSGDSVSIGRAQWDPEEPGYISPDRAAQAKRLLRLVTEKGIECFLPKDFVCDDGNIYTEIPHDRSQRDIGPETISYFGQVVDEIISKVRDGKEREVIFHNGVFGVFEDERFADGTRRFVAELRRAFDAGAEVYIGGGEGRLAVLRFGSLSTVTHAFTAGGTILKSMSDKNIGYLKSMYLQNSAK